MRDSFDIVKNAGTPPRADFVGNPTTGPAPLEVRFEDRSTTNVSSWARDFDADGTTDSVERNPVHVYPSAGIYTVKLRVQNAAGIDTMTKTGYIVATVADPPPGPTTNLRRTDRH